VRKIIQDIAEEDRATHAITREDIYNRVKYFGMSYEDTVAAADLCGRIKRALASDAAEQGLLVGGTLLSLKTAVGRHFFAWPPGLWAPAAVESHQRSDANGRELPRENPRRVHRIGAAASRRNSAADLG
jgi:hypothetical protein